MLLGPLWEIPKSFLDLCQNWLPSYTGKDRAMISIGVAGLLWINLEKNEQILLSKLYFLMISRLLYFLYVVCWIRVHGLFYRKEGCRELLLIMCRRRVKSSREGMAGGLRSKGCMRISEVILGFAEWFQCFSLYMLCVILASI